MTNTTLRVKTSGRGSDWCYSVLGPAGQVLMTRRAYPSEYAARKVLEGRPHIVDAMKNGEVQLVFNTTEGAQSLVDSASIRRAALQHGIPYYTTISGARAAVQAIRSLKTSPLEAGALQTYS